MIINTNVAALAAQRSLSNVENAVQSSIEKLSSGFRINHASDDAAGLGISNVLQADATALTQASRNAQQANSMLQVSEGATNTISTILQRMKELATQAGSDNTDDAGRASIKAEWDQLVDEIGATAATTKFQGKTLINGGGTAVDTVTTAGHSTALAAGLGLSSGSVTLGANAVAGTTYTLGSASGTLTLSDGSTTQSVAVTASGAQSVNFDKLGITLNLDSSFTANTGTSSSLDGKNIVVTSGTGDMSFLVRSSGDYSNANGGDLVKVDAIDLTTTTLGVDSGSITLTGSGTAAQWQSAITKVDTALTTVNTALGTIGAAQNRINYAMGNAQTTAANFTAAQSTIKDVDMAQEMTTFSSNQILAQAGEAMLAQANQSKQSVIQLIRGQ